MMRQAKCLSSKNGTNTNLPDSMSGIVNIVAGKSYTVSLTTSIAGTKLWARGPDSDTISLESRVGDMIDYYVVFGGGSIDAAIAGYRNITGAASMYAKWAYGFWQCKEHYHTQQELTDAAHKFRELEIPVDNFVQDWHYWGNEGWGPHWDPSIYPAPGDMVKNLSSINIQLMVSVWSKFDETTSFFKNMSTQGYMINGTNYYDVWNPKAREQFYQFSKKAMFDIGVDALWLDATEPEGFPNENHQVGLGEGKVGSGNALFNTYSLKTTQAIADGLRRDFSDAQGRRVFSLTRSSFAGQQRTGAALVVGRHKRKVGLAATPDICIA